METLEVPSIKNSLKVFGGYAWCPIFLLVYGDVILEIMKYWLNKKKYHDGLSLDSRVFK